MTIKTPFSYSHILKPTELIKSDPEVPLNTLELYLDYGCPFCLLIFDKWKQGGFFNEDLLTKHKLQIKFVNVPQPAILRSTPLHNVSLAVARYKPTEFWEYSLQLFKDAKETWNNNFNGNSPDEFNKILAIHANKYTGIEIQLAYDYLSDKDEGKNRTSDLKYFIRYSRTIGVIYTPTVAINGIVVNDISSETSLEKVVEIIKQNTL